MKTVRIIVAVVILVVFFLFIVPMTYFMAKAALGILQDIHASEPAAQDVDPLVSEEVQELIAADEAQELIAARKIRLGMTADQVRQSWGKPEDINRSVTRWGVSEQWVYEANYLYFDDGILTTIQE
jgi:superfamily II DNA or RNA helicase